MPRDPDPWVLQLDAALDAMPDSPTSSEVLEVSEDYEPATAVASALRRALGGGGGGAGVPTGEGSPAGSVTPSGIGALYVDTTSGGLYIAAGATDADWVAVGGNTDGSIVGIRALPGGNVSVTGGQVALTDVASSESTGNSVWWSTDGRLRVETGDEGQYTATLQDANGTLTAAAGGIKFPTADPHIAGAWWDNAGTLTKSAG